MKRHFIVAGVSALCMALAPTMAFGTESAPLPILEQGNSAPASASATNANGSAQAIGQSGGSGQAAEQTAINTQVLPIAAAPAVAAQVVPVNLNLPIRVASPGDNGSVEQSNKAPATAEAANVNGSKQAIVQSGGGAPKKDGAPGQTATQKAVNTQIVPVALAPAISKQILPINANVPVRIASPGDDGSVEQSNKAPATAEAANLNGSKQLIDQLPGKKGAGAGPQTAAQKAFNTQFLPIGFAPAISYQLKPTNLNAPIRFLDKLPRLPVDPFSLLPSPNGHPKKGAPNNNNTTPKKGAPTRALSALPAPPDAVTGLAGGLPLGAVTGLLPPLPVGLI